MTVLAYILGVLLFVVGLAVSVGLHEFGHLIFGKIFHVKVTQFMVGFGKTYPEIWINLRESMARLPADSGAHIALRAKTTAEIDAFHAAAVAAGAVSESAPSLRPHDRVRYYAAFIVDVDGNRIEAVTFPQD